MYITCNAWNAGSQEVQPNLENLDICSNHEDCEARPGQIKLTKGFSAKEPVKGHMASSFFHNLNHVLYIENMQLKEFDDIYPVVYIYIYICALKEKQLA